MIKLPYIASPSRLPDTTSLGPVHLIVKDLDRQLEFYQDLLKMKLFYREEVTAYLGSESDILLVLSQDSQAKKVAESTGLYHYALLYPSESDLAKAVYRLFELHYPNWPTDHGMSKTTYLKDAEGNDIELYIRTLDRANFVEINGQQKFLYKDGRISDGRDPLDLDELFSSIKGEKSLDILPAGTSIGHLHIYSRDIDEMTYFYRDILGFGGGGSYRAMRMGEVALSEEINHVIAYNSWRGSKAPYHSQGSLGIKNYTIGIKEVNDYLKLLERLDQASVSYEKTDGGVKLRDPAEIELIIKLD